MFFGQKSFTFYTLFLELNTFLQAVIASGQTTLETSVKLALIILFVFDVKNENLRELETKIIVLYVTNVIEWILLVFWIIPEVTTFTRFECSFDFHSF
jgi:hypothetical protein